MKEEAQIMIGKTINIFVSQHVKNALPEVLINYLINLVQTNRERTGSQQVFRLSKNKLNSKEVQDVIHTGESNVSELHRVFGCNPIDAEIIVAYCKTGYHMGMV